MSQIAKVKKVIKIHHGAMLTGLDWNCICGESLGLPQQNGLNGPTKEEIISAWSQHLAHRLVSRRGTPIL